LKQLKHDLGKQATLTMSCELTIHYTEPERLKITMLHKTEEIIRQLLSKHTNYKSPFTVNPKATPFSVEDADLLHCMTAQLLYLCKRARPDL
jgi:hypothetical protein